LRVYTEGEGNVLGKRKIKGKIEKSFTFFERRFFLEL